MEPHRGADARRREGEPRAAGRPGPTVERIELNTALNRENPDPNSVHPVLGDIEMRKALLYATPKQSIIDKLLFGKAKPGSSPVSQGWAAYKEPQEGYDPAKANAALDKAGWVKGSDGIRSKGGVRASLTYATTTAQLRERVQQVLVGSGRRSRRVKIQKQPSPSSLLSAQQGPRNWARRPLCTRRHRHRPALADHAAFITREIPTQADCSSELPRFKNADVDTAIAKLAAHSTSRSARRPTRRS